MNTEDIYTISADRQSVINEDLEEPKSKLLPNRSGSALSVEQ